MPRNGRDKMLLDNEAEAEAEPELYWPVRIDLVSSVVLAVPFIALTDPGTVDSHIPPIGTDARGDHCEVA